IEGEIAGNFENAGIVTATAIGGDGNSGLAFVNAAGINIESDIAGSFSNSGSVTASAVGGRDNDEGGEVRAIAIDIETQLADSFSNSGEILAESTIDPANTDVADALGVRINTFTGATMENTGSISAISDKTATAVRIANMDGLLVNTGRIVARSQLAGADLAIDLQAGLGQLDLHTIGFIDGQIHVNGHDVNFISAGPEGSAVFSIVDNAADQGVTPSTYLGASLGQNWLITGVGTAEVSAAFYDPSSYAAAELETAALLGLVSGDAINPDLKTAKFTISGATGSLENRGNRTSTLDNEADITSWALQAETPFMGSVVYFTLGRVDSQRGVWDNRWSRYSSQSEADGFYAGAGVHRSIGEFGLGLDIGFGELNHDQVRNAYSNITSSNSVRNTARFDSRWQAANLSLDRAFALKPDLTIEPGVRFAVISHDYNGYTEAGDFGVRTGSVDV
ncbi:MAG: autotransporter domain-containing protein, partial [Henriciella sp.]